jgi:hypothetical protein
LEKKMTRFAPSTTEARRIEMFQQERAERLASRIVKARHALSRGENATYVLALLDADTEAGS